jgi:hypothetical protein
MRTNAKGWQKSTREEKLQYLIINEELLIKNGLYLKTKIC